VRLSFASIRFAPGAAALAGVIFNGLCYNPVSEWPGFPQTRRSHNQQNLLRSPLFVFRRFINIALILTLLYGVGLLPRPALAQDDKKYTAEQIAETVILFYGSRERLAQIRRNGIENGRLTRISSDGKTEEATYQRRFMRGENSAKDKVRLDQKTPTLEYTLIYGDGHTWGLLNGATFTPRADATVEFLSQTWHGIDALLRYKENGSTLNLIGKEKLKGIDFYTLEVTDKEKRRTRYAISAKLFKVLWLDYEEPTAEGGTPVKFRRYFYDYKYAQNTLVPYRTELYEDGRKTQETRVMNVTYGVKLEDALFQNPEAQATTTARP
jgi:outer membrane lipoprotein-sorting protein